MKTREETERVGCQSMGGGCLSMVVFMVLNSRATTAMGHSSAPSVSQIITALLFYGALAVSVIGFVIRIAASRVPTASEVTNRQAAAAQAKREAQAKADAEAQRERERVAWEAGREERERNQAHKQAQEEAYKANQERLRREREESDRVNLLRARQAPPQDW